MQFSYTTIDLALLYSGYGLYIDTYVPRKTPNIGGCQGRTPQRSNTRFI
jgi:hypothetical protein